MHTSRVYKRDMKRRHFERAKQREREKKNDMLNVRRMIVVNSNCT